MRSSYIQNNYGQVFIDLIEKLKPKIAVEMGVLDGYSTVHIATGLRANFSNGVAGRLISFDLFDKYPYKHGNKKEVEQELIDRGLSEYVQLIDVDGINSYKMFGDGVVNFLHVDISNTGEILKQIIEKWTPKLSLNGVIAFEGGSEERDIVTWMVQYGMSSIRNELFANQTIKDKYSFEIIEPFPSLTLLTKVKE